MTEWVYAQYVVAVIDVLGQKDRLLKLKYFPKTVEDENDLAVILDSTAGYMERLRKYFESVFEAAKHPTSILDSLPTQQRHLLNDIRGTEDSILMRHFSDSIWWEILVDNSDQHCRTTRQLWQVLCALCGSFLITLQQEQPFRGAVELGFGVPIGPQSQSYGSALVKAHLLESEIANYPRVVIGDSLWNYLVLVEANDNTSPHALASRKFASDIKELISTDCDGVRILDFIGIGIKRVFETQIRQLLNPAYEALLRIQASLADDQSLNSHRLRTRYSLLRSYFESRLPLWQ